MREEFVMPVSVTMPTRMPILVSRSDSGLYSEYEGPTPTTAHWRSAPSEPPTLLLLLGQCKALILDTIPWGNSVPGAIGLWGAGIGGRRYRMNFRSGFGARYWR